MSGWQAVDWQAVGLSARLAAATAGILLVIAIPLAGWLAFTRRRWPVLVEAVVAAVKATAVHLVPR